MSAEGLIWDEDAKQRLSKVPFFVRKIAKRKIEKAAIKLKQQNVTLELLEAIKKQEMGE